MFGYYLIATSLSALFGMVAGIILGEASGLGIGLLLLAVVAHIGWIARDAASISETLKELDDELRKVK